MTDDKKTTNRRNDGKTTAAGILMLFAGVFNIVWLVMAFTGIFDIKVLLTNTVWITPFPYLTLYIGFGGNSVLASIIVLIFILGIFLSIIGGILVLIRRSWTMAIAGSIGAILCVPAAGIIALTLTLLSKREL